MSLSMKFPGAYFQGKDALEEFAEHTMCYGRSFLFVGSKSALRVSKEKLAHSFSGTDAQIQFELTSGVPCASEVQRVTKLGGGQRSPGAVRHRRRWSDGHWCVPPRWTWDGLWS